MVGINSWTTDIIHHLLDIPQPICFINPIELIKMSVDIDCLREAATISAIQAATTRKVWRPPN